MGYTYVRIELDDVDTMDLIEELEHRHIGDREKEWLLDLVKEMQPWSVDAGKLSLFLKIKDKYSLMELQEMFKEESGSFPIPKEQLVLELK